MEDPDRTASLMTPAKLAQVKPGQLRGQEQSLGGILDALGVQLQAATC